MDLHSLSAQTSVNGEVTIKVLVVTVPQSSSHLDVDNTAKSGNQISENVHGYAGLLFGAVKPNLIQEPSMLAYFGPTVYVLRELQYGRPLELPAGAQVVFSRTSS